MLRILLFILIPGGWVLHESQALVILRPSRSRSLPCSMPTDEPPRIRTACTLLHSVTFPPRRKNTSSDHVVQGEHHISASSGTMLFPLLFHHRINIPLSTVANKIFGWYMYQLAVRPVSVKSLTAGLIGMVGDALAQGFTTTRPYHLRRGLALMVDGVLSGPFMHLTYEWLEHLVPTDRTTTATEQKGAWYHPHVAAVIHVLVDCLVLDSLFVAMTIVLTGVLEGVPTHLLLSQFPSDYLVTVKASWLTSALLFPLQFCMFRFMPVRLRVLGVNFLDVVWDAVLSFNAHRSRIFM